MVFACSVAAAAAVLRHMLKALEELRAQAERIKDGDFDKKVVLTSKDELKELSDSLNLMSDQLQEQIEDLQFLLGAMAHEMKTPLTSIMGYADSLLHVRLSEKQREQSLEVIRRCAGRLDQMSGKLMQLAGLYENEEIERQTLDLARVVQWVYEENREICREKGIDFQVSTEGPGGKMEVQGDKMLLASLFNNLVSNSIKALEDSGKIQVILMPEQSAVCVRDNGCGIPEEDIPHVTKAFYMVDKSRSRRQQGAGLGLALAQRIVLAHGAHMKIESRVGAGTAVTVFFLRLPERSGDFTA